MKIDRLAPLAGTLFLLLVVVTIILSGEPPGSDDSAKELVDYWGDEGKLMALALVQAFAITMLVAFGASLRRAISSADGSDLLAALAFGGILIAATGAAIDATLVFALADTTGDVPIEVTQTLNALFSNDFVPFLVGFAALNLGSGLAAIRSGYLPKWFGWVQIGLFVLSFAGPVGFAAFLLTVLWIGVIGVVLYRRGPVTPGAAPGGPTVS